ncbi:hypothetical protein BT96DRAFT_861389 [Gymnopus androsaceus JB14]|uniref:Uncharacterized protein n=1 Tax=Gymnopus androsaceus JB14 TaxID=1447944 RepID=A0A6A4HE77_9AGAR|nr:hypothetical protein BT96DRAFT_861389 [Gymnopus androsaceus JB14]
MKRKPIPRALSTMWLIPLIVLGFSKLQRSAGAEQHPLHLSVDDDWDLNKPFTANTTANLVFATASSLLQSAPNLRYRNGHTIVPGIVPSGTLLYHGRGDKNIPDVEWVAFEPEVSYGFCRQFGGPNSCWMHTFAVARPLKIIYFDGAGASKVEDGAMDSQDLFTWGEIKPECVLEDALRIQKMCDWGKTLGLDGFVRSGAFPEIMLCDFTSLTVVSSQHLKSTPFKTVPDPDLAPTPTFRIPARSVPINSDYIDHFITVTERFSQYPGLTHVRLDLTRLVSFYDQRLAPSLVAVRSDKPRLEHRLLGITKEDILRVRRHLEEQILDTSWSSLENVGYRPTGLDWRTYLYSTVDKYGKALEDIRNIVNSTTVATRSSTTQRAKDAFRLLESLVQLFVLSSVSPPTNSDSGNNDTDTAWASSVFRECALTHEQSIITTIGPVSLTNSEQLLCDSVKGTTRELCRVLTKMWADGVREGLSGLFDDHPDEDMVSDPGHSESKPRDVLSVSNPTWASALLETWKNDLGDLMKWLDWGVWVRCKPACKELESCYLPTWPFSVGNVSQPVWHADNPQPRCLRKLAPFTYADEYSSE